MIIKGGLLYENEKGNFNRTGRCSGIVRIPISAMSAGAEGAYAPGDVDMDGFVTAHDAAVVSRALYVDNNLLTSEQKKLADVNGDGKITQEDADWIHENQVYNLGQLDESSDHLDSTGIFYQFYYVARKAPASF